MGKLYTYILLFATLLLATLPIVSYSDSCFLVIRRHDYVSFDSIDSQDAIIFYANGYQYLLVFSRYRITNSSELNTIVYYFPLPSKPEYFNISFLNISSVSGTISLSRRYIRYLLWDSVGLEAIPAIMVSYAGAGGGEGFRDGYITLSTITSKFFDVSLIETAEPDQRIFLNILRDKGYQGDLPKELIDVIDYYKSKGWKYFVIGVLRIPGEVTIAQHFVFKIDKIVYPLYVDRVISGTGKIKLVVVSADPLKEIVNYRGLSEDVIKYFKGIDFTLAISANESYLDQLRDFFFRVQNDFVKNNPSISKSFIVKSYKAEVTITFKGYVYVYEDEVPFKRVSSDIEFVHGTFSTLVYTILGSPAYLLPYISLPLSLFLVIAGIVLGASLLHTGEGGEKAFNAIAIHFAFLAITMYFIFITFGSAASNIVDKLPGGAGAVILVVKILLAIPFISTCWFTYTIRKESVENRIVSLNTTLAEYVAVTIVLLALTTIWWLTYVSYLLIAGITAYYHLVMAERASKIPDLAEEVKKRFANRIARVANIVIAANILPYVFLLLVSIKVI